MEVVILAGGGGKRFGGEKQFTPVAPGGAALLEVTAADAVRAGCDHVVVVTAPGREDAVRELFAARPLPGCRLSVVAQRSDDLPRAVETERTKPWGTAHALWAAREVVVGPFLLFNADDSYGPNAPRTLVEAMSAEADPPRGAMLGYALGATLSSAGTVSRAVCETDDHGRLVRLREYPVIDAAGCVPAAGGGEAVRLDPGLPVSMNAWAFPPQIFAVLERFLEDFLAAADLERDECYLPAAVEAGLAASAFEIAVVAAPDAWCGMTWPDDRERVARRLADLAALDEAAKAFGLDSSRRAPTPFGAGLVNDTWELPQDGESFLLQRVNAEVFPDPEAVVKNAAAAARRIDDALRERGDADPRHRLAYRAARDGAPAWRDEAGGVWRSAGRIPAARPADPKNPREAFAAAEALGRFPGLVAAGRGPELGEILPGFHDTAARLQQLRAAGAADRANLRNACRAEYERLEELAPLADRLPNDLPRRLVHNDAKLDNVLVDEETGEALCVIDLDTVMPGCACWDFGDLVRSAVSGLPEDEPDAEKVKVRLGVFQDLTGGYLAGAREWLTVPEREHLVDGALVITYEQALRFLADWLDGDSYYAVDDDEHNLRRARAQLALLEDLLRQEEELRRIVSVV